MPRLDIVATDAVPEFLNAVSLEIFRLWRNFALGQGHLGGNQIMHPSGRYASSISMHRYGSRVVTVRSGREIATRRINHIAIIADANQAPEAAILEHGHERIDMLDYLEPGTYYPMHRGGHSYQSAEATFPRSAQGRGRVRQLWAKTRLLRATGRARTPGEGQPRGDSNTSGTGPAWTIPAMPAYEPAHLLAELYAEAKGLSISVSE